MYLDCGGMGLLGSGWMKWLICFAVNGFRYNTASGFLLIGST
jgi:hypothetical protein